MGQSSFEEVWARLTRVISFFVGVGIMGYETVLDKADRPWLYAAAIGMMGLPIARTAEEILGRFGGSGPQKLPKRREQSSEEEAVVVDTEAQNRTGGNRQ